jgi:hypothetical protein
MEVYLDPGVLAPSVKYNFNEIAAMVQGARAVDIAGWDADFNSPSDNYPYAQLIAALHARGILAYAWLEPPFVDLAMWQDYPNCREKTETGRDAKVDWRDLESLETPACFQIAWQRWTKVLTGYDWDGVNIAELYFEPNYLAANFTPFSPAALAQFGHNPMTDFEAFLTFRTDLVTTLNKEMLEQANGLPNASHLDFELTVIDSLLSPSSAVEVGSSVPALAGVAVHGGASLEIEDPFTVWSAGPLRYFKVTAELKALVPTNSAVIDLNVVDRPGARPTSQMTGGELDLAVSSAASLSGRIGSYAVGTLTQQDIDMIPSAMAGTVKTTPTGLISPFTVIAHAPKVGPDARLLLDGKEWPTADGVAVVPAGQHSLTWLGGPAAGPGLTSFTGELSTAAVTARTLSLGYYSRPVAYAVVSAKPTSVTVDGQPATLNAEVDPGGGWSVLLPSGTHDIVLGFS